MVCSPVSYSNTKYYISTGNLIGIKRCKSQALLIECIHGDLTKILRGKETKK